MPLGAHTLHTHCTHNQRGYNEHDATQCVADIAAVVSTNNEYTISYVRLELHGPLTSSTARINAGQFRRKRTVLTDVALAALEAVPRLL